MLNFIHDDARKAEEGYNRSIYRRKAFLETSSLIKHSSVDGDG